MKTMVFEIYGGGHTVLEGEKLGDEFLQSGDIYPHILEGLGGQEPPLV